MSVHIADAIRTIGMALCLSVLVTNVVLFWRIGQFVVPPMTARTIIISAEGILLFVLAELASHTGQPLGWRAPLLGVVLFVHQLGLLALYRWTRRPDGRKVRHRMRAEYAARKLLIEEGLEP